jgi:hypothetical protein
MKRIYVFAGCHSRLTANLEFLSKPARDAGLHKSVYVAIYAMPSCELRSEMMDDLRRAKSG